MGRRKISDPDAGQLLNEAVSQGFRSGGFDGSGVDGLAKRAGLTSGAFYTTFGSKAEAFRVTIERGFEDLINAISRAQALDGDSWLESFADFYLIHLLENGIESACAVPTFAADVARANASTRETFEQGLQATLKQLANGLEGQDPQGRAAVILATLVGAASAARALPEGSDTREGILRAARNAILTI